MGWERKGQEVAGSDKKRNGGKQQREWNWWEGKSWEDRERDGNEQESKSKDRKRSKAGAREGTGKGKWN